MTNSYVQCVQNGVCGLGMCSSGLQFDVTIKPMSLVLSHGFRVLLSSGHAVLVVSTIRSAIGACACYALIADVLVVSITARSAIGACASYAYNKTRVAALSDIP